MMQRLSTLFLGCIIGVCQILVTVEGAISIETPSKEHFDHFKMQEAIRQEVDSDECRFDNFTWDRILAERKQELRWEARVAAYKAGLITTGLMMEETAMATHWTDRYSGFWFPHNFRRRRRSAAMADLVDRFREQEVLRNADHGRRRGDVEGVANPVVDDGRIGGHHVDGRAVADPQHGTGGSKCKQRNARHPRSLEANDVMNLRPESDISAQHRRLMAKLRRKLLSRRKRHLYEGGKRFIDEHAFPAKDYHYYDYNNMLTAVTLPSSTIKFVEEIKRRNEDVAQGADVHRHNMKLKEVFGGFHNDSELLTFLRNYHYENFTHEERKMAWYDDFMKDRIETGVEFFKKNLANYKKLYRSFREKSNRENNTFVNPDTEDQSAIIPHFEEHRVMNYSELYRYFRAACEHAEYKSSEIEPTPVNHYMPANYTSSPESVKRTFWSGESEAFVSDYDNERLNTSGWTRSKKRKRAVGPRVYGRINIRVYDGFNSDRGRERHRKTDSNSKDEHSENVNEKDVNDRDNKLARNVMSDSDKNGDKGYHRSVNELVRRNGDTIDVRENMEFDSVGDKRKEHVKRIDIRFQINQDNGVSGDTRDGQESARGKPNSLTATSGHSESFNVLNEVLELLDNNENVNFINNILSKALAGCKAKHSNNGMNAILELVENLINVDSDNRNASEKPFRGFEIYETHVNNQDNDNKDNGNIDNQDNGKIDNQDNDNIDNQDNAYDNNVNKEKRKSRAKRSIPERKLLTISKIIKTIEPNNDYTLHLVLEPTLESVAFQHLRAPKAARFKRNAADAVAAAERVPREEDNEEEEVPQDPNECHLMKRVFYWKKVRDANQNVVMSHEKSIEAISMNDYYKRRDREVLGITTKEDLESFKKGEEEDRKRKEEERLAEERILAGVTRNPQSIEEAEVTKDPDECPLMDKVFYWKKVRDANQDVVMSHQDSIDAGSKLMDSWHKRRDRHANRITLAGEYIPDYEEMKKGRRIDPRKGESLDRKKRAAFQEEAETYGPFPAERSQEVPSECGFTFKPPGGADDLNQEEEAQTYEPFEAARSQEAPNECGFPFKPPGGADGPKQREEQTYEPFANALKEDDGPGLLNTADVRQPVTLGHVLPDNNMETDFIWSPEDQTASRKYLHVTGASKQYKAYWTPFKYRGFKLPRFMLNRIRLNYTYPPWPVNQYSGLFEPKFVRLIYHGDGWVRHVHFISNLESKKRTALRLALNVTNLYLENFKEIEDPVLRAQIRAQYRTPKVIQNVYKQGNRTRFVNHFYTAEGDIIYERFNMRRVRMMNATNNKYRYDFRYYFPSVSKLEHMDSREPVAIQLHYNY